MSPQRKTLPYVLLQHKDQLKVYLEDPDLPVRVLPHDVCVGRGELPLSDEVARYLESIRLPMYKRPPESKGEDLLSEEAFRQFVQLAIGAGFASADHWYRGEMQTKKKVRKRRS